MTNPSKYPPHDPRHVCGTFCDGQDGQNSECARMKRAAQALRESGKNLPHLTEQHLIKQLERTMTSRDFCFWLQGFFEIHPDAHPQLDSRQVAVIKNHLSMVFLHEIDPSCGDTKKQEQLQKLHDAGFGDAKKMRC